MLELECCFLLPGLVDHTGKLVLDGVHSVPIYIELVPSCDDGARVTMARITPFETRRARWVMVDSQRVSLT